MHRQRAFCIQSQRLAELMDTRPPDRVWSALPLFWTAGLVMGLGSSLAAGATAVLQESFDPPRTLDLLERERVTTIHAPPHVAARLADLPDITERDLSALVRMSGRSPLPAVLGRTGDAWDPAGAYGLSETFTVVTGIPADADPDDRGSSKGPLLPGVQIRILGAGRRGPARGRGGRDRRVVADHDVRLLQGRSRGGLRRPWLCANPRRRLPRRAGISALGGPPVRESSVRGGVNVSPYEVETALSAMEADRTGAGGGRAPSRRSAKRSSRSSCRATTIR